MKDEDHHPEPHYRLLAIFTVIFVILVVIFIGILLWVLSDCFIGCPAFLQSV